MKVCVPVADDGSIGARWGRAARVAVAEVTDGAIAEWAEFPVGWDVLHDDGTEGAHHARVARFLRDHGVEVVAVEHLGGGMQRMLATMGIRVVTGQRGDARSAVAALTDERG